MNEAVRALVDYWSPLPPPTRTEIDDIADNLAAEVERLERELAQAIDRKEAADHHRLEVIRDMVAHPRFKVNTDDLKVAYCFLRAYIPHCQPGAQAQGVEDLMVRLAQYTSDIDEIERTKLRW